MLEFEKKILLSKEEYEKIRALAKSTSIYTQKNYYYDTDKFYKNGQGITYRIREKNGEFEATVKNHGIFEGDGSIEYTKVIADRTDDDSFTDIGLKLQGSLTTERCVVFSNEEIKAVLDKNTYLDTVDYELEIEYAPQKEEKATAKLRELEKSVYGDGARFEIDGLEMRTKEAKSKSQRFFERKKQMTEEGENR